MFENSASSRMQLVGVGDLRPPGSCLLCGSGTRQEGYIDLGVSYDYVGNLYLCWFCTVEAAEILGCMIPKEVQHLKESYEELAAKHSRTQEELDSANERLSAVDIVIRGIGVTVTDDGSVVGNPTSIGESTPSEDSLSGESETNGAEPTDVESVESDGPSDTSEPELVDFTGPGTPTVRLL